MLGNPKPRTPLILDYLNTSATRSIKYSLTALNSGSINRCFGQIRYSGYVSTCQPSTATSASLPAFKSAAMTNEATKQHFTKCLDGVDDIRV